MKKRKVLSLFWFTKQIAVISVFVSAVFLGIRRDRTALDLWHLMREILVLREITRIHRLDDRRAAPTKAIRDVAQRRFCSEVDFENYVNGNYGGGFFTDKVVRNTSNSRNNGVVQYDSR